MKETITMPSERDKWDLRCVAISFMIPLIGNFVQSIVESYYDNMYKYLTLLLILIFLVVIPLIIRVYFTDLEDKIISSLKTRKTSFAITGITCFCIRIGYVVVYTLNILS